MTVTEAYTPLEMLMLCQELNPSDSSPPSFVKISESLKNNALLRESASYNPTRLEPDSLAQLYLSLMKEEARIEVQRAGNFQDEKDGEHTRSHTWSSSMESVNEASRHVHLLPSLLNRLYFRYRNHAIKEIESEECKYRSLQRDIQEINRGEWDARLQLEGISSKRDVKEGVTSIETLLVHESDVEEQTSENAQHPTKSPLRNGDSLAAQANKEPKVPQDLSIEIPSVSVEMPKERLDQEKPTSLDAVLPQSQALIPQDTSDSEALTRHPKPTTEPKRWSGAQDPKASPEPIPSEKNTPSMPPRQPQQPGYSLPSPDINQRIPHPPPQPQATAANSPSPRLQKLSLSLKDRSPQSSVTLPSLSGVLGSTVSPLGPLDTLADMAGQQPYRPTPTMPSPRAGKIPAGQSHPIQLPTPRNYHVPGYPYYDSQQPYGIPYPYGHASIPSYHQSNQPGVSSYQGSPSSPGRGPGYGNVPLYQSPAPSYSQYSQYSQGSLYNQTPAQNQFTRNPAPRFFDPHTPIPGLSGRPRPPRPSIDTSTTSTKWKKIDIPNSIGSPTSPTRPLSEEISPISAKSPSPFPETFHNRTMQLDYQSSKRGRGSPSRRGVSRGRGARAVSTASTAAFSAQTRTRSQSFLSPAEDTRANNPPLQFDKIITGSAAPPAGDEDSPTTETTATTADDDSRQSTRRRRGTLRSTEMAEVDPISKKRKRTPSESLIRSSSPSSAPNISRPNYILGSRNFPRTSATIMNDISAHKLASIFAKPLTERDAPGYKNLIYRPQDLKSIKSAIAAGGRALVSAADGAGVTDPGSPAGPAGGGTPTNPKSSTVWIPATADVVPPKGIVNSAQLEKELMRMFANAVMFNPDPKRGFGPAFRSGANRGESRDDEDDARSNDDVEEQGTAPRSEYYDEGAVVKDTREMFTAVERSVTHWRAAERASELSAAGPGGAAMKGPIGRLRGGQEESGDVIDELEDGPEKDEDDSAGAKRRRR